MTAPLCYEGGNIHTWQSRGLDISASGLLVNVRSCVRCGKSQHKRYGAGSRIGWTTPKVSRPDATEVAR